MAHNILIAGAPGIGKTSLILHLHRDLTPLVIRGFYKDAIQEYGVLKGYRIICFDMHEQILAHVHLIGPDRYEEFGLNIDGLNKVVARQLTLHKGVELFLIDEIGPIECRSDKFCQQFLKVINSDIPVIATLGKMDVLDILQIRNRNDVTILKMTHKNRESLWKTVLVEIAKPATYSKT